MSAFAVGWVRRVLYKLVPESHDAPRRWRGLALEDPRLTPLRVLRFGDCSYRENDGAHWWGARPGYPLVMAEALLEHGYAVRFNDIYVTAIEKLPATAEQLVRHVKLDGDPDIVLIAPGASQAVRVMMPTWVQWRRFRFQVSRRVGVLAWPGYRVMHFLLRRFGHVDEPFQGDIEPLARFIRLVRAQWPRARLLALTEAAHPLGEGKFDLSALRRVQEACAECYREQGVPLLDCREEVSEAVARLGARAVHGANGYDLRRPGHEILARRIIEFISSEQIAPMADGDTLSPSPDRNGAGASADLRRADERLPRAPAR